MTAPRRVGIVINDLETLVASQTTWMLARGMVARGHEALLFPAGRLGVDTKGRIVGHAVRVTGDDPEPLRRATAVRTRLRELDLILVRTNPGREVYAGVNEQTLMLLARVEREGVPVINSPLGLARASTKLYLTEFDADMRPTTIVTRDVSVARRFTAEVDGPCVLKPVSGTRGRDVFFVDGPDSPNLAQIVEVIARQGPVMVQAFVPEAAAGDTRVVILGGAPLTIDGQLCAVRRQPGRGDFRSNIHVGGTAAPAELDDAQLDVARRAAKKLAADGIALAGLDLIGRCIVEVNVFSTGGFRDAERFTGLDFTGATIDWLVARLES